MKDETAFFAALRAGNLLGPTLSQDEVEGCQTLTRAFAADRWPNAWAAYGLATAYHETAGTMQPIRERGGYAYFERLYGVRGDNPARAIKHGHTKVGDGARYSGRGYPQLTWLDNYRKAGDALGIDLVADPDLAMHPDIAAQIMVRGMRDGWFTGVTLSCLPMKGEATRSQFCQARRIINGTDKADQIAGHALDFQFALNRGGWGQ